MKRNSMLYDCFIVMDSEDSSLLNKFSNTSVFLTVYCLDTLEGKKKGNLLLREFGTRKTPFVCVRFKGETVKCFYKDNLENPIDSFIDWIYFNNMENTEIIKQFETHLQQHIKVPVQNLGTCKLPTYATIGSSGADLRAYLKEAVILQPGERKLIPTGLHMSIPKGFELQVRPRSGLALKNGISVLNTPGSVDGDYRGDIGVILMNFGDKPFTVNPGDKIAQGVFARVYQADFEEVDSLDETERGSGGFGHTGI